jgi:O-antigen/teichoic acid export membrane protein
MAAKGGTAVATLLAIPVLLDTLGPTRFGLWMTIASLLTVLAFADLGIGNGLVNTVARHAAQDDATAIRVCLSSAAALLGAVALGWVAALALAYPLVGWDRAFPNASDAAVAEFGPSMAMVIACVSLGLPFAAILRVQAALQRGYAAQAWLLATSLASLAAVVVLARAGAPLAWMALVFAGIPVLANALNAGLFFGSHATWRPAARWVDPKVARRIARAGLMFLIPQLALSLGVATDSLLIARFLGPDAVADYAPPAKVFALLSLAAGVATAPLWPAYAEALARGDRRWIREAFRRSLLLVSTTAAIGAVVLALAMPAIIERWIGRPVPLAGPLLAGLAAWSVVESCGIAVSMLLNGLNALRTQAMIALAFAAGCVTARVALLTWAPELGVAALPIGAAVAYSTIVLAPYARIVHRHLRETLSDRADPQAGQHSVGREAG